MAQRLYINDVINKYVSYVANNYGNEAIVRFDVYGVRSISTKFAEQCGHTSGKMQYHIFYLNFKCRWLVANRPFQQPQEKSQIYLGSF